MMILFVKLTKGIGHKFYQLMKSSPIGVLVCTDYVRMYISSRDSGIYACDFPKILQLYT
jgi:hypothetical protein